MSPPQTAHPFSSRLKGKAPEPPPDPRPHISRPPNVMDPPHRTEMQEEVDKRERAAMILDSWELLALYSRKYGEISNGYQLIRFLGEKSIPQTRLRLQKQLSGLEDESDPDWEDETEGEKLADTKEVRSGGRQTDKGGGSGSKRKASGKS